MDDPVFKSKYLKYKNRVKIWEKDFKKKFGRIPSKHDIRDAPREIRESYKMYYKLKTSLLEDTLSEVLFEDGFDVFDNSQGDISMEDDPSSSMNLPDLPQNIPSLFAESSKGTDFSNLDEIKSKGLNIANIDNVNEDHIIKQFEPVEVLKQNEQAWGDDVSNKAPPKKSVSPAKPAFKSNLNPKLFKSSSFSKRNPRKSLSRTNLDTSKSMSSTTLNSTEVKEVLPDLETILSQRAKEQPAPVIPIYLQKPKGLSTVVDKGWLDRCSIQNGFEIPMDESGSVQDNESEVKPKYGLSNINIKDLIVAPKEESISVPMPNEKDDSDSVVSNSEDENESQSYRHIAKRRRILSTIDKNAAPEVSTSDVVMKKAIETISELPKKEVEAKVTANDPEEPKRARRNTRKQTKTVTEKNENSDGSDNDSDFKETKTKKKPIKKKAEKVSAARKTTRKSTGNTTKKTAKPDISETQEITDSSPPEEEINFALSLDTGSLMSVPRVNIDELQSTEKLAKNYVNTFSSGVRKAKPALGESNGPVNEKQSVARAKLEDKIASGKLNENFVRINLKKKVFVRGKKTMNFSRYKKTQWKQKKAAALIGPEMNMGGCDGGVLTCFNCGQPGHFAQQCKIKGDSLLPVDAELDDASPFPTLEEAEQMASQQAMAVHSRNIDKLPQAANPLIYKGTEDVSGSDSDGGEDGDVDELEGISESEFQDDFELETEMAEANEKTEENNTYVGHQIPEDFLQKSGLLEKASEDRTVGPLYDLDENGSVRETTEEVYEALKMFGHTDFRKGQDRAIMRILSGQSTLVTLSTGSGKTLCYQLPAYLYSRKKRSITLVISPLVSLMEDQVTGVPHFLRAHCLHTNQTPQQRLKVQEMINNGEVDILLVSPEAVVAGERSTGFGAILRKLPPIAFACIDEAHCVSQWSHNFRPSYLMICKVLKNNLGVKTILGLTATATFPTRTSIIRHLGIPDGENGIISDIPLPDNLILSVSQDENKDAALITLLRSDRFEECQSIIVYCTRRNECERVAGFIRTCLQDKRAEEPVVDNGKKKRKRLNWQSECYHAGMAASRRRTIQNAFMKNELRIVVATIAFGMGINKPDIRAVIHYNMPSNFESYVQEIGRAGRDGKISHCHLFLDSNGSDQNELRRHIYANSIDRHVIRKLLQRVFVPCSCDKNAKNSNIVKQQLEEMQASQQRSYDDCDIIAETKNVKKRICPGHEIGISIENTVQALDLPEENISTLLCYIELDGRWGISTLSNAYIMCKVISYGGPKHLKQAAKDCPPLAMAIALELKKGNFDDQSNIIEFSVVDIAATIGWNSGVVKHQLKQLEWTTVNGFPKRSSISVSYFNLGFRIKAPGDFTSDEIDDALDTLNNRAVTQERTQLIQLQYVIEGLSSVAFKSCHACMGKDYGTEKSEKLKNIIREYFRHDYPKDVELKQQSRKVPEEVIANDVRSMLNMYPDNTFTGRNLARIFHGIQSPNFPAVMWGRCKYWRAHSNTDFNYIVQVANSIIVKMRS